MAKMVACAALAVLVLVPSALHAAERTWTGTLVDSRCSTKIAEGGHRTPSQMDGDHACSVKCITAGEQYEFVSNGKVYHITNQTFTGLNDNLGYRVALSGRVSGNTITVSKIGRQPAATR